MVQVNWNRPNKKQARSATIMDRYAEYFAPSLLPGKQYYTMCGRCADENGKLRVGCELDQLLKAGFLKPQQFYGIEIDPEIHSLNSGCHKKANWICGDFYFGMLRNLPSFNPGVVNIDTLQMPCTGIDNFATILSLLTENVDNVLVVVNFVMVNPHNPLITSSPERIVELLQENHNYQYAINKGNWIMHPSSYNYLGGEHKQTPMATIIMVKKDN
jgi:hypothetical protein